MSAEQPSAIADTTGTTVPPVHKLYRGADRYLCGTLRASHLRGKPSVGGVGPTCQTCEVIYLNIMYSR